MSKLNVRNVFVKTGPGRLSGMTEGGLRRLMLIEAKLLNAAPKSAYLKPTDRLNFFAGVLKETIKAADKGEVRASAVANPTGPIAVFVKSSTEVLALLENVAIPAMGEKLARFATRNIETSDEVPELQYMPLFALHEMLETVVEVARGLGRAARSGQARAEGHHRRRRSR